MAVQQGCTVVRDRLDENENDAIARCQSIGEGGEGEYHTNLSVLDNCNTGEELLLFKDNCLQVAFRHKVCMH